MHVRCYLVGILYNIYNVLRVFVFFLMSLTDKVHVCLSVFFEGILMVFKVHVR